MKLLENLPITQKILHGRHFQKRTVDFPKTEGPIQLQRLSILLFSASRGWVDVSQVYLVNLITCLHCIYPITPMYLHLSRQIMVLKTCYFRSNSLNDYSKTLSKVQKECVCCLRQLQNLDTVYFSDNQILIHWYAELS